jgi:hypothetical protein
MKKMELGQPTYFEWIASNAVAGSKIGVDPTMIPSGNTIYQSLTN